MTWILLIVCLAGNGTYTVSAIEFNNVYACIDAGSAISNMPEVTPLCVKKGEQ